MVKVSRRELLEYYVLETHPTKKKVISDICNTVLNDMTPHTSYYVNKLLLIKGFNYGKNNARSNN